MTNEEIIFTAINKATHNGLADLKINMKKEDFVEYGYRCIIFSHDFARAFWGEDNTVDSSEVNDSMGRNGYSCLDDYYGVDFDGEDWKYYLQQMVLEEDPILYLKQFLKK